MKPLTLLGSLSKLLPTSVAASSLSIASIKASSFLSLFPPEPAAGGGGGGGALGLTIPLGLLRGRAGLLLALADGLAGTGGGLLVGRGGGGLPGRAGEDTSLDGLGGTTGALPGLGHSRPSGSAIGQLGFCVTGEGVDSSADTSGPLKRTDFDFV